MVELGDQIEGLLLGIVSEHIEKFLVAVYPLRERHGDPGPEPDEVQPGNGRQLLQIPPDDPVGVHEGVAAGDQDIGHRLVALHVGHGLVHPAVQLILAEPHHPLPEAVAAVHGTLVGAQQQHRLGVLVLETLHLGIGRLAAGIEGPAGIKLVQRGDAHPPDGVIWVLRVYQGQVVGRDHHGEPAGHCRPFRRLLRRPP
jgi:hypothetical protein